MCKLWYGTLERVIAGSIAPIIFLFGSAEYRLVPQGYLESALVLFLVPTSSEISTQFSIGYDLFYGNLALYRVLFWCILLECPMFVFLPGSTPRFLFSFVIATVEDQCERSLQLSLLHRLPDWKYRKTF